jgi:GTP-binding protein
MVVEEMAERGLRVFTVSAASGEGLRELTFAMAEIVTAARVDREVAVAERIVLRPAAAGGGDSFTVEQTPDGWLVRGTKPERWVRQTDFANEEAVGFLADRLARLGVEQRLAKLGAVEGDPVLIGPPDDAVVFDFRPDITAGAEMLGRRGEDERLREDRPAAGRRRAIQEAMPERGDNETRADVARRLDRGEPDASGGHGYEVGSADDPDWLASDPGTADGQGTPGSAQR